MVYINSVKNDGLKYMFELNKVRKAFMESINEYKLCIVESESL